MSEDIDKGLVEGPKGVDEEKDVDIVDDGADGDDDSPPPTPPLLSPCASATDPDEAMRMCVWLDPEARRGGLGGVGGPGAAMCAGRPAAVAAVVVEALKPVRGAKKTPSQRCTLRKDRERATRRRDVMAIRIRARRGESRLAKIEWGTDGECQPRPRASCLRARRAI